MDNMYAMITTHVDRLGGDEYNYMVGRALQQVRQAVPEGDETAVTFRSLWLSLQ